LLGPELRPEVLCCDVDAFYHLLLSPSL
jgi:hypothetical protein